MKKIIILLISIIMFSCSKTTTEPETEQPPKEEIKTYKLTNLTTFGYIKLETAELGTINLLANETKIIQLKSLTIKNQVSSIDGLNLRIARSGNNTEYKLIPKIEVLGVANDLKLDYLGEYIPFEVTTEKSYLINSFEDDKVEIYNPSKKIIRVRTRDFNGFDIKSSESKITIYLKIIK
jgi:hypothetical protein